MQTQNISESQRTEYWKQLYGILFPPQGYLLTQSDIEAAQRLGRLLGKKIEIHRILLGANQEINLETGEVLREF